MVLRGAAVVDDCCVVEAVVVYVISDVGLEVAEFVDGDVFSADVTTLVMVGIETVNIQNTYVLQ